MVSKTILFALICVTLIQGTPVGHRYMTKHFGQNEDVYPSRFFTQRLDHFNAMNQETFQQRYYINDDHWNNDPQSTNILYIGGEGAIDGPPSGGDESAVLAKLTNGRVFALEHRFYGASIPEGYDLSLDSLKYLTSRQAIADLVTFQDAMDAQMNPLTHEPSKPQAKWVIVGGSYPGALAGWVMEQHRTRFEAGIASSGVVNAILDFTTFDTVILEGMGTPCGAAALAARKELEARARSRDPTVFAAFGVPADTNLFDFFYYVADAQVMGLQYGHKEELCDRLNEAYVNSDDMVDALADYLNNWWTPEMNPTGYGGYDREVLAEVDIDEDFQSSRCWFYQKCSEMAYFQNAPAINSLRPTEVSLAGHLEKCAYVFGDGVAVTADDPTERTNQYYGGADIVSPDTYYADFLQDPWWQASVMHGRGDSQVYGFGECLNCGHCCELHADKADDPVELTELRKQEREFVLARV